MCVHFKISVRILQKLPYTHRILVEEETKDLRAGLRSISWWSNTLFQRRRWHPTPVLLPGKSCGLRSLVGCSPWGHWESDMTEWLTFHFSLFTFIHWRRKWQPTPVFLPGGSQGWGSLVGCRLWGHTESDTTEVTWQQQHSISLCSAPGCIHFPRSF